MNVQPATSGTTLTAVPLTPLQHQVLHAIRDQARTARQVGDLLGRASASPIRAPMRALVERGLATRAGHAGRAQQYQATQTGVTFLAIPPSRSAVAVANGRRGGQRTFERYGRRHYVELSDAGNRKGGQVTKQRYGTGTDFYGRIGKAGLAVRWGQR